MRKLCILILSILFLCTGCQKTPEAPIVVGKDQQQMIEKAQEVVSYATDTPTAGVDWAARLGAPKRYEAKLTSAGGHLVVDVDATVSLPEVELPVVRVSPYLFTDEDVRLYAKALLGDDLRCVDPWSENSRIYTKQDGSPIIPGTTRIWLQAFEKRNGLRLVTPHKLRHTFATLQIAYGTDIRTVAGVMGHSSPMTTLTIYAHQVREASQKAALAMSEMLTPKETSER